MACADLAHLVFLPSGDAALTRRAGRYSTLKAVLVRFSRSRNRYERQGILVEESALARAEQECLADADARGRARERRAEREIETDAQFRRDFARHVATRYPGCPEQEVIAIAEHACAKYSGRVGRSAAARQFDAEAITLAVRAHVRHAHTEYDKLLSAGWDRHDARAAVAADVARVLDNWEARINERDEVSQVSDPPPRGDEMTPFRPGILCAALIALAALTDPTAAQRVNVHSNTARGGADVRQAPGRRIGSITTRGNLILMELDSGVIADHNLFDLDRRTIRFTPSGAGFRAENMALQWDSATGPAIQGNTVRLTRFAFPFSGRSWDSIQVLSTGLITFGGGYNDLRLGRFVHLQHVGPDIVNTIPIIAAFLKQRMNGTRSVSEHEDRLVVTWSLSEPVGGQQDVTFTRTPHNFQAVLHRDGRIDLSYREMTARDAVVGVYTVPAGGAPPTRSTDLSAVRPTEPPRPVIFEAFHHYGLPGSENLACTVIQALGDRFDFMVWYADFRVDDQEAGTRSVGDIGQNVSGIGPRMDAGRRLQDYCSQGRLQVTWYQPVWVGAVQAQERHPNGNYPGYNMAVAQIGHELAHRWSTRTRAIVGGDTIELRGPHDPWGMSGATHWPQSVTTPVPFPYSRPVEASIMGGANWKDNGDGTFTHLANGTMNPASGFSYLELYLMGLLPASAVPDFFVLRNQRNVGRTPEGNNIVAAEKVPITIQDVIAHNGPRIPSFENSPKAYNTAMVAVTLHGRQPSTAMLDQIEGIRAAWIGYWSKVTGGVSTMTTTTGRSPSGSVDVAEPARSAPILTGPPTASTLMHQSPTNGSATRTIAIHTVVGTGAGLLVGLAVSGASVSDHRTTVVLTWTALGAAAGAASGVVSWLVGRRP